MRSTTKMQLASVAGKGSLRGWPVLWLLAAAAGCHGKSTTSEAPVEKKKAQLTNAQAAAARAAGFLGSLTPPYAAIELLDDPVSVPSSLAPCVSGGLGGQLINN